MRAILGSGFLTQPEEGRRSIPIVLDFTNVAVVAGDLEQEMTSGYFGNVQCVWIDNSQNAGTFTLKAIGYGPLGHTVQVQPFTQGYYPLTSEGPLYYSAATAQGQKIPIEFLNHPMPYLQWGPTPGITVVPPLTNSVLELAPAAAGDNIVVAGVLGQTVKLYRAIIVVAQATNLKFWSGAAAGNKPLSGTLVMTAGGSITLQPSGIPWFTTQAGDGLNIASSNGVNIGGQLGFVQS